MSPETIATVERMARWKKSSSEHEDVIQDVYVKLLENRQEIKSLPTFVGRMLMTQHSDRNKHSSIKNKHQKEIQQMGHPTTNSWASEEMLFRALDEKLDEQEKQMVSLLRTTPLEEIVKSKRFGCQRTTYKIVHTIKEKIKEVGSEVDA